MELVKHIRRYAAEDVRIRKAFPKRFGNIAKPGGVETFRILALTIDPTQHILRCSVQRPQEVPTGSRRDQADRATVLPAASDKALLGEIGDVASEDGEDVADMTVGTSHEDPSLAGLTEWEKELAHSVVKKTMALIRSVRLIERV